VPALYEAARARRLRLEERPLDTGTFRTEADHTDDLVIHETSGRIARLTHWSFGQLATIASAPPSYLRTLPATIASDAINHGLRRAPRDEHQLFVERTAPWTVHAMTSPRYARVHHHELAARVLDLMVQHPAWHLPLGYKDGEYGAERVPSGAYLGDRDMFPTGGGRNVTFPARQYAVNGERRSFALLRPIADVSAQDRIRDLCCRRTRNTKKPRQPTPLRNTHQRETRVPPRGGIRGRSRRSNFFRGERRCGSRTVTARPWRMPISRSPRPRQRHVSD
jgi:hypothetical protein